MYGKLIPIFSSHSKRKMDILLLILFNLIFFWKIWLNPFTISRSELLSTFYPSWLYIGRQARKCQSWKTEPCFWLNFHAHPVLSSYYPPHVLTAWIASFLDLDTAFVLLTRTILVHFIWMSFGWYFLLSQSYTSIPLLIFGAITLSYSGYTIKQQPCIIYTIAWFPWILLGIAIHQPFVAGAALGMSLLAGYYPIGIQMLLISFAASVVWISPISWVPIGLLLGLPQLIPFLKYLPKTIRMEKNKKADVGFWEKAWFPGITTLLLIPFSTSRIWPILILSVLLVSGLFSKYLPRISYRWLFTVQFCLGWMAVSGLANINTSSKVMLALLFIQGFDLYWHNSKLIPTLPYAELPKRPSLAFKTQITTFLESNLKPHERVSGLPYPLFTGIVNSIKTLGYCGGMQLKLMAKWRGDENPNGSGCHDWFKLREDDESLDRARVRFAFTSKKLNWRLTPFPRLYENPRLSCG